MQPSVSSDGRGAASGTTGEPRGLALPPTVRAELDALYADYAAALDEARYDDWIALFTDDCEYRLQPRENHERGLPLATLAFESKGMLRDRIYGITTTLFHAPYAQRHVIGPLRVRATGRDEAGEHEIFGGAVARCSACSFKLRELAPAGGVDEFLALGDAVCTFHHSLTLCEGLRARRRLGVLGVCLGGLLNGSRGLCS